jgi:hypothetical protein
MKRKMIGIFVLVSLMGRGGVRAWTGEGHVAATALAVSLARDGMPSFLGEGAGTICHCSVDPDVFKFQADCNALYDTEYPDHFFDLECFTATTLPRDRASFTSWCLSHHQWFSRVGTVPYAVTEATYRLAVALAEYRRWPQDPAIRAKCLVYAGLLSHYSEDMVMPLHATVDYDGRSSGSGDSPHTGIHIKVDALLAKVTPADSAGIDPTGLVPFQDVLAACLAQIRESHGQVDRVYSLEKDLPDVNDPVAGGSKVEAFSRERLQVCARFTARLFLTAWDKSRSVEVPVWHSRGHGEQRTQNAEHRRRTTATGHQPSALSRGKGPGSR